MKFPNQLSDRDIFYSTGKSNQRQESRLSLGGIHMDKKNLTEYADFLLKAAAYKCGNISEAEDLVQETLLAALTALEKGKIIDEPKAWLTAVLNRKYYDMLRKKYRKPTVSLNIAGEIPESGEIYDGIERSAEAEEIRRCIAYLSRIYRQVLVRFYMHGESVKKIAEELGIPENTVKSRLDAGRKHIRKEFAMENYTSQSYEPDNLYIACSGRSGINEEPFSLVGDDKIAMNLLILAYEKPVSVPELARAIGIPTVYIEPIIDKFVNGELMKRVGDKVYTDFIIYTEKDRTANFELESSLAEKLYSDIWKIMQEGFSELHESEFHRKNSPSKKIKLDSFFAVRTMQSAVNNIRNEACGGIEPFDNYPDRPNGGKWYAIGNMFPANYNYDNNKVAYYSISGEAEVTQGDYRGQNILTMCEYDTALGKAQLSYKLPRFMTNAEIMQTLYAVHSGRIDALPVLISRCFENLDYFIDTGFLAREDGKTICDIPIITSKERFDLYELSEKYDNIISDKFHDELMKLMKNPVILPPHLKSVPQWQRYMHCCSSFPMMVILNAKENGLFLNGINSPAPAVFIAAGQQI